MINNSMSSLLMLLIFNVSSGGFDIQPEPVIMGLTAVEDIVVFCPGR